MQEKTATCSVIVRNRQGLHARPAHMLVETAMRFRCQIEVIKGDEPVDGKSILSILTLGAEYGTELTLRATGEDAEEAVQSLADLFAKRFGRAGSGEEE